MAVYVDRLFKVEQQCWCHMICDGDLFELHEMAERIGLKREWFQVARVPHYDLVPSKRALALKGGAIEIDGQSLSAIRRAWMLRWHGGNPDWID